MSKAKRKEKNIQVTPIVGGKQVLLRRAGIVVGGLVVSTLCVLSVLVSQTLYYVAAEQEQEMQQVVTEVTPRYFPVGVNPEEKVIEENPNVELFFTEHIGALPSPEHTHTSWIPKVISRLALMDWYQNLASVSTRILVINSGERKEQIANNFKKILGWTDAERTMFLDYVEEQAPKGAEGKFFPGTYTVSKDATPEDVAAMVHDRFRTEVLARYDVQIEEMVPLSDVLVIASLIEREAYDFTDMRYISGVIWNRLFIDMRLQIDATLQYAKGGQGKEKWWPIVLPKDKYIASVYNTYAHSGLPPAPIANPSLDAILAALNPRKTDCMYYFHDRDSQFHCSKTYEEHVSLLKEYYGRGK